MNKISTNTALSESFYNQMAWMDVIFSNIGDGVIMANKQGKVIFINSIMKNILQVEDESILDKHIDDFVREIKIKINENNECNNTNNSDTALNGRYDKDVCIYICSYDIVL
jgi:signal transduction histidine kinase